MYRKWWLWAIVLGMASVIGAPQDELARARRVNQQAIGIDTHIDTLQGVLIENAGIDHVGIGSDYDGVSSVPVGLEDVSHMFNLTAALLKRGYSEADIEKILGGNFLRVIREVTGK